MSTQWIVVANASLARFFKRESSTDPLVALPALQHPESRMKGVELADDRPGHEATDNSAGGNRFEPRTDPRRKEHQRFAREVAEHIDKLLVPGAIQSLWICASDPFMGELRAALSEAARHCVQRTIESDYTSLGLDVIEERLNAAAHAG